MMAVDRRNMQQGVSHEYILYAFVCAGAVELHLSGLIGTASHPDMQNIRITGGFFGNGLHWQFEVEKIYKRLF
jgi:hypothetical protein